MPVVNFTEAPNGRFPWLSIELKCVMAIPDDQAKREAAVATLVLDQLTSGISDAVTVPTAMLRASLRSPGLAGIEGQIALGVERGSMAGEVLRRLLQMSKHGQPLVGECLDAVADEWSRYENHAGTQRTASRSTVQKAWTSHRSVAHFWAATRLALDQVGAAEWQITMELDLPNVLAIAMDMLQRGARLQSADSGGPKPLLDLDRAWVLPADLNLPEPRRNTSTHTN